MTNKKTKTNPPVETKQKFPLPPPTKDPVKPVRDMEPQGKSWTLSIGLYPGILFGIRTYEEIDFKTHVLYLPFVDFALEIDN